MGIVEYNARRGCAIPFVWFIVGVYILLTIPKFTELTAHEGIIEKFRVYKNGEHHTYIYVQGRKTPYVIRNNNDKELLLKVLDKNKEQKIIVWTKEKNLKDTDDEKALQMAIDDKIIYYYETSFSKKIGWGLVIIGGILIPIVVRERRKIAAYMGEEWMWGVYKYKPNAKEQRIEDERNKKIADRLSHYGINPQPINFMKKEFDKYFYFSDTSPFTSKKIFICYNEEEESYPISMIYFTDNPAKTGDPTRNTVREFIYRSPLIPMAVNRLPLRIKDYKKNSRALKKRLDGQYQRFMEY